MPSRTAVLAILRTDALRFQRDRFLIGMSLYVVAISIAMRWVIPWIGGEVERRFAFDLSPYFPMFVSHFVIQLTGLLVGILGGVLLLEGREDRTVKAVLVSPVSLGTYLAVLGAALCVSSLILALAESALIRMALPPWMALIGAAVAGAPAAAMFALFIGAVAENKTEAFAYMKIVGVVPVLASAAWFVPEPWQWLAAVYPPYSASKAYWVAEAGLQAWPWWVVAAWVASAVWIAALGWIFMAAARR